MRALPATACLVLALPVSAAEDWRCAGVNPDWTLRIDAAQGAFDFPARTELEVMDSRRAENRDWPLALTLIGARDTAILLIEPGACTAGDATLPYRATVLTQRVQTPLVLVGCCAAPQ